MLRCKRWIIPAMCCVVLAAAPHVRAADADKPPVRQADPAEIDRLTRRLADDSPAERAKAAKSLATLGPAARSALPALIAAVARETDEQVGPGLIEALSSIGLGDLAEIDQLIRIMRDKPDTGPAMRAMIRLVSWIKAGSKEADAALPELARALQSKNAANRAMAAICIGSFGGRAKDLVPKLIEQNNVETIDDVKVYLVGATVRIHDEIDALCGVFVGPDIHVEMHRGTQPTYEGAITRGKARFAATGTAQRGVITGTFKTANGDSFPFQLKRSDDGYELQSGNKTHRLTRQPQSTPPAGK
jgi:hypothetical protein